MSKKDGYTRRQVLEGAVVVGATLTVGTAFAGDKKKRKNKVPQVPRRVLGKTGAKIPILLLGGAVDLDPKFDPKIAEALRYGINYIDAADCYGGHTCEAAVASFHKKVKNRDKLWITSKSDDHDVEGFQKVLDTSLKELETDYIDMYYLHALRDDKWLTKDLAKVVAKLKKQGKIKHFGFSCHHGNVAELLTKAAELDWVDSVMFRYNFRTYGDKQLNKAMDAAHKAKVGLIAMKTQGSASSFKDKWEDFESSGKFTKHQAVLKAVWADERITAAVSHMDTMEKLEQNIAAALDKTKLGALDRGALDKYAAATRSYACDGCDHICGAAVDAPVQIGDTMRCLMYHDSYGETDKAKRLFRALPVASRRLADVDFSGADAACPHGVDVGWHMRRAAKVLG